MPEAGGEPGCDRTGGRVACCACEMRGRRCLQARRAPLQGPLHAVRAAAWTHAAGPGARPPLPPGSTPRRRPRPRALPHPRPLRPAARPPISSAGGAAHAPAEQPDHRRRRRQGARRRAAPWALRALSRSRLQRDGRLAQENTCTRTHTHTHTHTSKMRTYVRTRTHPHTRAHTPTRTRTRTPCPHASLSLPLSLAGPQTRAQIDFVSSSLLLAADKLRNEVIEGKVGAAASGV
jgi:hypothetical protein